MQMSVSGSMNTSHFTEKTILRPVNDTIANRKRDLLHLDMLNSGVYHARRGMLNLSLPMIEEDLDYAIGCFEEFLDSRAGILAAD